MKQYFIYFFLAILVGCGELKESLTKSTLTKSQGKAPTDCYMCDKEPPQAPSGLRLVGLDLQWGAVAGAESYRVYQGTKQLDGSCGNSYYLTSVQTNSYRVNIPPWEIPPVYGPCWFVYALNCSQSPKSNPAFYN